MKIPHLKITTSMLILALAVAAAALVPVHSEATAQTIFIRPDGSIDPSNAPLTRSGDTYTFTDNAYCPLVVQKAGVVIDGAGYTLQGKYNGTKTDSWMIGDGLSSNGTQVLWTIGIDMAMDTVSNLTIKNLKIQNFSIGIYLWTPGNTITGNIIKDTIVGILLAGNDNTLTQNRIANNDYGVFFGSNNPGNVPSNVDISLNCFSNNAVQFSGCVCKTPNSTEAPHTWDNGKKGNYWADYNGTDDNQDGIGDTPYTIDTLNIDRYPLMHDPTSQTIIATQTTVIIAAICIAAVSIVTAAIIMTKKKTTKPETPETQLPNQPKS